MKYDSSKSGFVPGFGKQKSVVGAYTSDDNSKTNPLADSQLMSSGKESHGDYSAYSIGRTVNDKPRPSVQSNGHGRNEG
jgi:hypothetical protein